MKFLNTALLLLASSSFVGAEEIRYSSKTRHGRRLEANDGDHYRVWVHYKEGHEQVLGGIGVADASIEVNYDMESTNTFVLTVDEAGYEALENDDNIDLIEEDFPRNVEEMPNDYNNIPEIAKQIQEEMERFGLAKPADMPDDEWTHERSRRLAQTVPYGINLANAQAIWDEANKGAGVTVCVLDTGMYTQHEDFNFNRFDGETSNAIGNTNYPWYEDGHSHGTHVTGTIAALDNDVGVVGVAPDVNIHVVRVFSNSGGYIWSSSVVNAAERCEGGGARVINMSLGGAGYSSAESARWDILLNKNILPIAAAGNSGRVQYSYPASYPSIVSVAAVSSSGNLASFSTRNDRVEVAAAGVGVLSTLNGSPNRYGNKSGTSMACPHAAGIAALLMAARPHATAKQVREAMQIGVEDRGAAGRDIEYGFGIVKADLALAALDTIAPPPSNAPTVAASDTPTVAASDTPTVAASDTPTVAGSGAPSVTTSGAPSSSPTVKPTVKPTARPTAKPTVVTEPPTPKPTVDDDACGDGKSPVVIEVNADGAASEITTQIVRDDEWVVFEKSNYRNNRVKVHNKCYDLNRCWVFNVFDSAGNGLDGGSIRLIVDGEVVLDVSDYDAQATYTFGECAADTDKECGDKTLVEITVRTDDAHDEISTQIVKDGWDVIFTKSNYKESRIQKTSKCLNTAKNCYTFTASDSAGNGITGGYVKLELNNEEKLYETNFGTGDQAVSHTFGECGPRTCDGDKTPVTIKVLPDGQASELTTKFIRSDEFVVFEKSNYVNNELRVHERCMNLDKCWRFNVVDAGGNGIAAPGYVAVEVDNVEKYRASNFGSLGVYEFGDCSPPEDKVCSGNNKQLAKVTVRTDSSPQDITARIVRDDGKEIMNKDNYKRDRVKITQKCVRSDRCHTFVITDDVGDGLEEPGYFSLEVGGELLVEDSDFGERASYSFGECPEDAGAPISVASCGPYEDVLRVEVKTDNNGSQTGIKISGEDMSSPLETYDGLESDAYYSFETCVPTGGCRNVEVTDSGNDGLCCSNGTGYASVYLNGELMGQVAEFGSAETVSVNCFSLF